MSLNRNKMILLYPYSSKRGGMVAITEMYYKAQLFENGNFIHFNTELLGSNNLFRFVHSIFKKSIFLFFLLRHRPMGIVVMTSSHLGFYEKILYCLIAKICNTSSFINPVGGEFIMFYNRNFVQRFLVKLALKIPNGIFIGSSLFFNFFKVTFPKLKVYKVENPILLNEYGMDSEKKFKPLNILFIGSLSKSKGVKELVLVIKALYPKKSNIKFHLVGSGPLKEYVKTQLKTEIENGFVNQYSDISHEEKKKLLNEAGIFILLSSYEVTPISILEAMASKSAIISTNVGGISDIVIDNFNGFLVDKQETTKICSLIEELNSNPTKLKLMGENSHSFVAQKYDINIIASLMEKIIKEENEIN
jgi:glycosyltransferase involved in cell wall biosynthesis